MFDISIFKKYSRIMLKGRYKTAVPVVLIFYAMTFLLQLAADLIGLRMDFNNARFFLFLIILILWLLKFCVSGFFLTMRNKTPSVMHSNPEPESLDDFFDRFADWFAGIKCVLWQSLWIFLWSVLFVIPGIVKAIAYSQMIYIVAENPGIPVRKAMNISKVITRGYKADIFFLTLSFVPWFLLSLISFGAAGLWVLPYYEFTKINAYYFLKQKALKSGVLDEWDFTGDNAGFKNCQRFSEAACGFENPESDNFNQESSSTDTEMTDCNETKTEDMLTKDIPVPERQMENMPEATENVMSDDKKETDDKDI